MRLVDVSPDAGDRELLPVCSCCRMRALRESGSGRICPDCDRGAYAPPNTARRPPPEGTTGGV